MAEYSGLRATRRGTILVVDDNADARELLQLLLEHVGYTVRTAADGVEGLACLQEGPRPDVMITDLSMPKMDGWQLVAEKSRDPSLGTVAVVILSANADTRRTMTTGVDAVLQKPVDFERLIQILARLMANDAADPSGNNRCLG